MTLIALKCIYTNTLLKKGENKLLTRHHYIRKEVQLRQGLLEIVPKSYICPFCGKWHEFQVSDHNLEKHKFSKDTFRIILRCQQNHLASYVIYTNKENILGCSIKWPCLPRSIDLCIKNIKESENEPIVTYEIEFTTYYRSLSRCHNCRLYDICTLQKLGKNGDGRHIKLTLGFKFNKKEYDSVTGRTNNDRPKEVYYVAHDVRTKKVYCVTNKDTVKAIKYDPKSASKTKQATIKENQPTLQKQEKREESNMKKTTIWEQLYEHSPKENVEILKEWADKYKPTLQWALPVVSIYGAYRILNSKNSKLTVDNIDDECNKKLGFTLDALKDKKVLNELLVLGGLSAGAYTAIKAASVIYNTDDKEVDIEDVEESMDKLDGARKKFQWIQPKTEAMLPVAVSVIIVYVMTQKPAWFEYVKLKAERLGGNFSTRARVYFDLAKLFVADKFKIDLNNEEDCQKAKKFLFLAGIVGIGCILYGKKILSKDTSEEEKTEKNDKFKEFISQVLYIMKKLMPTAFAGMSTFLVTKKLMDKSELDTSDFDDCEEDEDMFNQEEDSTEGEQPETKTEETDLIEN